MVATPARATATRRGSAHWCAALISAPLLVACALDGPGAQRAGAPGDAFVTPWLTITGGWLARAVDAAGFPVQPGSGPFQPLIFPAAVALRDREIAIADSGANRVYRYDAALNALLALADARALPGTRLAYASDFSLYVLDPLSAQILRLGRDGKLLQRLTGGALLMAQPTDLTLADATNTLLVADAGAHQMLAFRPLGASPIALIPKLPDGSRLGAVTAIGTGSKGIYLLDRGAGTLYLLSDTGVSMGALGAGHLRQPQALAVDRYERVYVSDAFDNAIKVFDSQGLIAELSAAELGIQQISALAVSGTTLAVADGPGAKVVLFSVRAPQPR